jgi:hypothetical protein
MAWSRLLGGNNSSDEYWKVVNKLGEEKGGIA